MTDPRSESPMTFPLNAKEQRLVLAHVTPFAPEERYNIALRAQRCVAVWMDSQSATLDWVPPEWLAIARYEETLLKLEAELAEARRASAPSGIDVDVSQLDADWLVAWLEEEADESLNLANNDRYSDELRESSRKQATMIRSLAAALPSLLDAKAGRATLIRARDVEWERAKVARAEVQQLRAQHARAVKAVEALRPTPSVYNNPPYMAGWDDARSAVLAALSEVQSNG